jgi:hypothetical protein
VTTYKFKLERAKQTLEFEARKVHSECDILMGKVEGLTMALEVLATDPPNKEEMN